MGFNAQDNSVNIELKFENKFPNTMFIFKKKK